MAIYSQQITVTSGVNRLDVVNAESTAGSEVMVRNMGTVSVWVGGATITALTTANGFQVDPGEAFTINLGRNEGLYGVTAVGTTCLVHVIEQGAS